MIKYNFGGGHLEIRDGRHENVFCSIAPQGDKIDIYCKWLHLYFWCRGKRWVDA